MCVCVCVCVHPTVHKHKEAMHVLTHMTHLYELHTAHEAVECPSPVTQSTVCDGAVCWGGGGVCSHSQPTRILWHHSTRKPQRDQFTNNDELNEQFASVLAITTSWQLHPWSEDTWECAINNSRTAWIISCYIHMGNLQLMHVCKSHIITM